jgi:hypothetical protein
VWVRCEELQAKEIDVTHQVHAVTRTGHQADIADRVQRAQFVKRQALMHKVYRHKLDSAETSVDTTDELVDGCAQILVLLDVLSRRHGKLNKDNLSDPLWVLSEEEFKSMELLRNAFDIIKPIDPDDDLDAIEALLKGCDALLNGFFLQVLRVQRLPVS